MFSVCVSVSTCVQVYAAVCVQVCGWNGVRVCVSTVLARGSGQRRRRQTRYLDRPSLNRKGKKKEYAIRASVISSKFLYICIHNCLKSLYRRVIYMLGVRYQATYVC